MTATSSHRFPLFISPSLFFTSSFVSRPGLSAVRHNAPLHISVVRCGVQRPERHDSKDWMKALNSLPRSMILKRVAPRLIPNVVSCSLVTIIYQSLPASGHFSFSPLPHTFLATLMSLTLVFRSNAAYNKYDEGRRLWGKLINISRALGRLSYAALPQNHAMVVSTLATCYPYALMEHLYGRRSEQPISNLVGSLIIPTELRPRPPKSAAEIGRSKKQRGRRRSLPDTEVEAAVTPVELSGTTAALLHPAEMVARINRAENKPLEVVVHLGIALRAAMNHKEENESKMNGYPTMSISVERQMMEAMISDLIDIQGACERIVKTPIPLMWSRHTSRLLSIWTLTLPTILVPLESWFCIPTCAFLSWAAFSLEEIAHIMEDPFLEQRYCLPLEGFCKTIENDLLTQLTR